MQMICKDQLNMQTVFSWEILTHTVTQYLSNLPMNHESGRAGSKNLQRFAVKLGLSWNTTARDLQRSAEYANDLQRSAEFANDLQRSSEYANDLQRSAELQMICKDQLNMQMICKDQLNMQTICKDQLNMQMIGKDQPAEFANDMQRSAEYTNHLAIQNKSHGKIDCDIVKDWSKLGQVKLQ